MSGYTIYPYDCIDTMLWLLDEKSVHCVVTSPPYFNLRDYKTAKYEGGDPHHEHDKIPARAGRGGSGPGSKNTATAFPSLLPAPICSCGAKLVDGQIGLEATPDEYVAKIVEVMRAVRRVLRDDGTVWLNIGDTYSNAGTRQGDRDGGYTPRGPGVSTKSLVLIPARVSLALQADGWIVRNDIIWQKPNAMPQSSQDRLTTSHEHIFLLAKRPRYYFDMHAVKEPASTSVPVTPWAERDYDQTMLPENTQQKVGKKGRPTGVAGYGTAGFRHKRDVWSVPTQPYGGAHYAAYPPKLIEPCILAGSPPSCCAACGAPRVGKQEKTPMQIRRSDRAAETGRQSSSGHMIAPAKSVHLGYFPSCSCNAPDAPAVVLDPFGGTGTTALVANRHGRRAILCEINPEYIEAAHKRIAGGK